MSNPIAIPGTVVPIGSLTSPGGAQGVGGIATTTAAFTVPPVGSTATVTVTSTSWAMVGEFVYVAGAGGSGQGAALQITAISGSQFTLLNPQPPPAIPLASSSQPGLLNQLSGNTTDFVDGTNNCQNLGSAIQPTIWSARLRSFNAAGNPTFECDQRNVGNTVAAANGQIIDRWWLSKGGTLAVSAGQQAGSVLLPNTNFQISRNFFRVTLTTQEAVLAASDFLQILQYVEGPSFRELQTDVHSLQVLVRSSVVGLVFGISLRDQASAHSLVGSATISAANTWTLLSLPNLSLWTSSATFSSAPGINAYQLAICLAAGSTYTASSNGVWLASNSIGAVGQSNFAASPVNSTFDIAFVQHEPGAVCTTPIDCPFTQNYDECLKYYQKSYDYAVKPGSNNSNGAITWVSPNGSFVQQCLPIRFHKPMAKDPAMYTYGTDGTSNAVTVGSTPYGVSSYYNVGMSGFGGWVLGSAAPSLSFCAAHYTADSGW